jgi:hypothetical protein
MRATFKTKVKGRRAPAVGLFLAALCATLRVQANDAARPLWVDFDMRHIEEPRERVTSYYYNFFGAQIVEQTKQAFDLPRWIRAAAGRKKSAANVNSVDEVPDSSWFTNRHHLRRMSREELARGPDTGHRPDFGPGSVISGAKSEGVTPGLEILDARGTRYIVKFDQRDYAELQSGAEVIVTKILYACGYNVPENYIAYLNPSNLQIGPDVTIQPPGEPPRALAAADLAKMLNGAAMRPDGTYRVLASRHLVGKPKGPFAHVGIRPDDPNDLIPHEHRRELRGLRVVASWLNHWDMKEDNTLDMYVEESGRKFLRHYLIDFGSSLGGGLHPLRYAHGREYLLDAAETMKDLLSLGYYTRPDEKTGVLVSAAMGIFSAENFDPGGWKPTFPVAAFENMTDEDAFWATRIVLAFTKADLEAIIATADYTNPQDAEHLLKTLVQRQQLIARHWLSDMNPLAGFRIEGSVGHERLLFADVLVQRGLAPPREYQYRVTDEKGRSREARTREELVRLDITRDSASPEPPPAGPVRVTLAPAGFRPVEIILNRVSDTRPLRVVAIRRR